MLRKLIQKVFSLGLICSIFISCEGLTKGSRPELQNFIFETMSLPEPINVRVHTEDEELLSTYVDKLIQIIKFNNYQIALYRGEITPSEFETKVSTLLLLRTIIDSNLNEHTQSSTSVSEGVPITRDLVIPENPRSVFTNMFSDSEENKWLAKYGIESMPVLNTKESLQCAMSRPMFENIIVG